MDRRRAGAALAVLLVVALLWWLWPRGAEVPIELPAPGDEGRVQRFDAWQGDPADRPLGMDGPAVVRSEDGPLGLDAHGTDPETVVTCSVEPALASASVQILDDALPEIPEVARIEEGVLVIPAPRPAGSGVLRVEGYVPVPFSWADGRCTSEPLVLVVGSAAVVGKVYNADGEVEGSVRVDGCGSTVTTGPDGSFYLEGIPGRECTVQASRVDGIFTATSPIERVTPVVGSDQIVDLHLPPFRTAGLGIVVRESTEGLVIDRALSGGSASDAGLRAGDRVLAIDGEDAEMLSLEEFVELALGEAGTDVELEVEGPEGIRRVTLERREM